MTQLELGETAEETHTNGNAAEYSDAAACVPAAVVASAVHARPTFLGVMRAGSGLLEPAMSTSGAESQPDPPARHVGLQYVAQLVLTGGPLMLADLVLLAGVIGAAKYIVLFFGRVPGMDLSSSFLPVAAGFLVIAAEMGLYPGIRLSPVDEFRRLAAAVTSIFTVWIVGVAILTSDPIVWDRLVFVAIAYVMYLLALPVFRGLTRRLLARCSWWGFPTLVCGYDATAVKIYEWMASNCRLGLRPVGVIANREAFAVDGDEPWYAGEWHEANHVAKRKGAYWVVVVPPEGGQAAMAAGVAGHLSTFPHIHILSELTGLPDHWVPRQELDGLSGIHLQQNLMLPLPRVTKRFIDLIGGILCVLVLLPLLFYVAVAVKLSSRGAIIYGHERFGKNGRRFKAWKFRSMFENSSDVLEYYLEQHPDLREEWEKDHKLRYDPRITRIGRFIRKTSIDELPQLWNVIRGQMSLVGPRPIVAAEIEKYGPYYGLYTMVTPGITGLWQVSGRNNTTYEERVQLDAYYVRNWSPWMDMYLLVRTVRIVLFAHGAY
jgi:Undecaprenyl-phosphate galactose phosphotransferase WbaP